MAHMEALFSPGMTWDDFGKGDGKWNIEHDIPVAFWLAIYPQDPEEAVRVAWSLWNLRPMWESDHKEKTKVDMAILRKLKRMNNNGGQYEQDRTERGICPSPEGRGTRVEGDTLQP